MKILEVIDQKLEELTADVKPTLNEATGTFGHYDEVEARRMFRCLLLALNRFADYPFKKKENWHFTSGQLPALKHNYIDAELNEDISLTVVVPLKPDSPNPGTPMTKHGKDLVNFLEKISRERAGILGSASLEDAADSDHLAHMFGTTPSPKQNDAVEYKMLTTGEKLKSLKLYDL